MRTVKAGIIGTGFIGPAHVEAVRRLGFVEVIALCENGKELARTKAAQLNIERAYGTVDEMLADPDVEVVHDCTPNNLHFEINKRILEAGKHCVSEKPLAMTTAESSKLVSLAKTGNLVAAINFNYRYNPLVQQARSLVERGDVGDVFHITGSYTQDWLYLPTDWNWRLSPELSGESRAIADVGSHWCDCIQFVSGLHITRVSARLKTVYPTRMKPRKEVPTHEGKTLAPQDYEPMPITTEDYACVLFELSNGAVGAFHVSQVFAGRKNRLFYEVAGSKCSLVWDQERPNELQIGYREKPNEVLIKDPALLTPAAQPYAHYPGGHPEAYPDAIKNFVWRVYTRIVNGSGPIDFSTFVDGHNEMAICEAIVASGKTCAWTDVKY